MITSALAVTYLANIIKILQMDGKLHPKEQDALGKVFERLQVDKNTLEEAVKEVAKGRYFVMPVGRFSDKIRNLEDMLYVALVDGELSATEKDEMLAFVEKIGLTDEQVKTILTETKIKIDLQMVALECNQCGSTLTADAKFCTACGTKVGS
jgi:Zn finger protein HypA/HybF involved in hydrogenase expression